MIGEWTAGLNQQKLDKLSLNLRNSSLFDYVIYIEHPRKMLLANFMGGLARDLECNRFYLLGAVVIYLLQVVVVKWKLPLIGEFISEIVNIVQENLRKTGGRISG
jgi:hypothetical protein